MNRLEQILERYSKEEAKQIREIFDQWSDEEIIQLHKDMESIKEYLGEAIVEQKDTKFKNYDSSRWAMYFLEYYGRIDGVHHKNWVLDQIARVLKGTPIIIKLAKWNNGHEEYRIITGTPSQEYIDWVAERCDGEDGKHTYFYDEGVSP